jgi:two-component system OmpR family response regulator
MRLLSLNVNNKLINRLEYEDLYICDIVEDIDDALYHVNVRFYNLVLIKENSISLCKHLLKTINNRSTAVVVITDNHDKKFEIDLLKSGTLAVLKEPLSDELILAKLESIHRENFARRLNYKNYLSIDRKRKAVYDQNENELNIRGKSFEVLSYLLKNRYRSPISKDEIVYALWDEPEMVSDNIIEVNVNQIRNALKKWFGINLITTVRNRGYKI